MKAQQRLFNLRRLKKFGLSPKALTNFYRCTIESILSGCITAWYGNCSAHNRKALQRLVRSAQRITGGKLPALQETYTTRCHRKAIKIIKDNNHPSHCLFTPLSSRMRARGECQLIVVSRKCPKDLGSAPWTIWEALAPPQSHPLHFDGQLQVQVNQT
ncbi:uncharacterized protein ACWYII_005213 [Salvelinus alpinus]